MVQPSRQSLSVDPIGEKVAFSLGRFSHKLKEQQVPHDILVVTVCSGSRTAQVEDDRMDTIIHTEPQDQLRSICRDLVSRQENVFEFQRLLSNYPTNCDESNEPAEAAAIRERLGQCVREWTGEPFAGFTIAQMQMWRAIVVDRRLNIAPSLSFEGRC